MSRPYYLYEMNADNKRIVRNTGLLYFRLIFLTLINLYTVRVTLDALGGVDYGVYNVIASVVASLSILSGAMSSASQRFLAFHLGRNELDSYGRTFTLLLVAFAALALILCGIGEGVGAYFIGGHRLNIGPDRVGAAWWVFQTSLVAFAAGLITIPYTASIIANERMDAFALFSIVEGVLKLAIVFYLLRYGGDRLILYSILTMGTGIIVLGMSALYCKVKFPYCKYELKWNPELFKQLSGYTGWNLFGSISGMLATQGQNILLNIFFGPLINASKGIADRVRNVIGGFSVNLYMAVSPQIIKSYASGDKDRTITLMLKSSKVSFLLIFVMSFPLICCMDMLLGVWLGADAGLPDVSAFCSLILAYSLLLSLEPPLTRVVQATGDIKRYQISVGVITLSFIPIAALVLSLGAGALSTLVVLMVIMGLAHVVRVVVVHRQIGLPYGLYMKGVVWPVAKVTFMAVSVYLAMSEWETEAGLLYGLLKLCISMLFGLFVACAFGLDGDERSMAMTFIEKKLKRK